MIIVSCSSGSDNHDIQQVKEDPVIEKNENVTTTTSTDIDKLGKLLDFSIYRPISVEYKYTFIDNSGQNERLSVPGPSDYSLEASMTFDSLTFKNLQKIELTIEWMHQNYNKEEFDFSWLPEKTKNKLMNSKPNYHGHPDFHFKAGVNAKLWYLYEDSTILLIMHST